MIIAYVTGFLVLNAHLARLGFADLDFVNARYFLAAANFAFFLTCFYLFVGRAMIQGPTWLSQDLRPFLIPGVSRAWAYVTVAHSQFSVVFFCCLSAATYATVALWEHETVRFYAVLGGAFLLVYTLDVKNLDLRMPRTTLIVQFAVKIVAVVAFFTTPKNDNLVSLFWVFLGIACYINFVLDHFERYRLTTDRAAFAVVHGLVFLCVSALTFGGLFYGKVSPTVGGARPFAASVGVTAEARRLIPGTLVAGDGNPFPALLIYQTPTHVFLDINSQTLRLRSSDVPVIVLQPEKKEPLWTPLKDAADTVEPDS